MNNLYPFYLVLESESSHHLPYTGNFTEGDTMSPAAHKTEFAAYTCKDKLYFHIRCYDVDIGQTEEIRLNFDPDHSGRRPHNLVQITVGSNGELKAGKMEYDIIHLTPVERVSGRSAIRDGLWEITIDLPLDLLHLNDCSRRNIGFNIVRTRNGFETWSKWSGLPGELAAHYLQGAGDLICVKDLTAEETNELIDRVISESNTYYTKWEKQKLPAEIAKEVRAKKSGFSLRIKKNDAERARFNACHTEWGAKIAGYIYDVADYWAAKSDDELFDFILPGNPRAMTPSQYFGDPLTGGNRMTLKTCLETPFRFYNENTGEWWYPGKKVINPKTGEEVIVEDNGEGFLCPEGFANPYTRCMLIAAYRHYRLGMAMGGPYCPSITDSNVVPNTSGIRYSGAIPNLAYAYILSGDIRYAYKAAILIGRIAELYPFMNGGYHDGSYSDTVYLSEPSTTGTEWKKNLLDAYDLIFDGIDLFHPDLKVLFAGKPDAENQKRETPFDLRRTVEQEMIPYIIYSCELERSGASDWSMRLLELEMAAAALIQNGELLHKVLMDSQFSLFAKLKNGYYRDGKYAYDSSEYVEGMSAAMMRYPDWTYQFQDDGFFPEPLNLFEDPRFGVKEIITFYYRYKNGYLTSSFGDVTVNNLLPVSEKRKKGMIPYLSSSETVFRRMPSARDVIGPVLAQYSRQELHDSRVEAVKASGRGINHTLLLLANALTESELEPYRNQASEVQPSFLLQDSEISILRTGTTARNAKHLVLYGQPTLPHCHGDKLGLWIGGYGIHMLAFGGHYPFIWIGPKIGQWELHSASCNVVLIDGRNQEASSSIQLEHYEGDFIQVTGMDNREAYPGSQYERWAWLIQAPDGDNAYVLDCFHVAAGTRFDYNTHGLDVSLEQVAFEGVADWIPLNGTLAGPDVPLYSEPGYGWMKAVCKAKIVRNVSWTYPYGDCGLKITALCDNERELYCCLGEKGGQEMRKSTWDTYLLLRDESEDAVHHAASFVTIMEPFEGSAFIRSIKAMERLDDGVATAFSPIGICVSHPGGYRDILISVLEAGSNISFRDEYGTTHTTDALAMFIRYKDGRIEKAEALGFTTIASGDLRITRTKVAWQGTVTHVDLESRQITIKFSGEVPDVEQLKDYVCFIDGTEYKKPSPYYIRKPIICGDRLTFHTDITLLRGEAGWRGTEKSLVQQGKTWQHYEGKQMIVDVKPGDTFTIRNRWTIDQSSGS